ncbi:extracellular solute-binding protein [Saccharomonospora cyanea]|uniref:ABC-type sugar transport system, periplasmic component n=1 Tax=Saccharomonospora cyanea NA-134 TaxID=882082 RepID=H5XLM4_9PSEU|nr:extracellular solute-binding protein [Saccharomonospora cyanea]EHR60922.1 ABC-type sugar transport system, periplasmic component [Saccharomonospora cyanea NA-134]
MTRRTRATALVAATAMTLAACSGGDSAEDGTVELTMLAASYSDNTKKLWEEVIAGFEKANKGVTVNLEMQSWENINDVIRTRVQSNEAPDILSIDAFAGYVEDELLYSAEEVLSQETIDDFQDSFRENASVNGTQYGFPLIASARALFVNNDLLEQAGVEEPPTTWDELYDTAKAVTDNTDAYGYGLPLGSEESQAEAGIWFLGAGGGYGTPEKITVDTPQNLEAARFMKKLHDDGLTQPDAGATQRTPMLDQFIQGRFGMAMGLPPIVGMIEEKNPDLDYSIVDIPTKDGEKVTLGVADHLMAFRNDEDKAEQIGAFLDYFYQAENYVKFVETEGFLPVTKSGAEQSTNEAMKPFLDLLPHARFYPSTNPTWATTQAAMQSQIGLIATGKDPKEVLAGIQAEVDNA